MSKPRPQRPILVQRIHWWIYPAALPLIIATFLAAAYGWLPALFGLLALFCFIFWLSSLGFALYARFVSRAATPAAAPPRGHADQEGPDR